jgi:Mn2+/Fe2+ NRAMP family transporter
MAWSLIFSVPLMIAIQEISGRIGRVSGRGIAGNLRQFYPRPVLYAIVFLLVVANTINIGADLGAMAAALKLLVGGPVLVFVVVFGVGSALAEVFISYARYAPILKWLTLSLLSYVAAVFVADVPWGDVAQNIAMPKVVFDGAYFTAVVAVLGTTISPYLFFWQAEQEVEENEGRPGADALRDDPASAPAEFKRIRIDTAVGMVFSNIVALCILITTAATLNAHGITDIQTAEQAAEALKPIAGDFAFAIFAIGIIGTGLLAVPVLAGSAAYAVGEAMRWPSGLARKPGEAKAFYGVIAFAIMVGVAMNFSTAISPFKALVWAAVINGVVAVPVMVMMMLMTHKPEVMGALTLPRGLRWLGWLATLVMGATAAGLFLTM